MKEVDSQYQASVFSFPLLCSFFQRFNEVTEAEVTLQNSGKVGFIYAVLSPSTATADSPLPGVPLVIPSTVSPGIAQVINPDRVSGCPREDYRENKGKKTKEKKKKKRGKTRKSRQEKQGCKQLLLGGREAQASVILIDFLNGLCWQVALLSYSNHWQRHDCLGSSLDPSCWALVGRTLEPDDASSPEGHLTRVV